MEASIWWVEGGPGQGSKNWASCVLFPAYSKAQFRVGRLQVGLQSDLQTRKN